jgi:hypothetical protein
MKSTVDHIAQTDAGFVRDSMGILSRARPDNNGCSRGAPVVVEQSTQTLLPVHPTATGLRYPLDQYVLETLMILSRW